LCSLSFAAEEAELPALHKVFKDYFLIGVSVDSADLPGMADDASHSRLLRHFNAITPENEMKWEILQPIEGKFDFVAADAIVEHANRYQMSVTGHTLVWHRQTPEWVFKASDGTPAPREQVIARLRAHIHTAMHRYKGQIHGWDVVNEALSDKPGTYLRDSPWLRAIGEEYIVLAFQFAREADPDAKLYYNDYSIELPHKRENLVRLLETLKAAGATPDAVNIQGHFSLTFPRASEIEHTLEAIAALGLRANISELDVSVFAAWQREDLYRENLPVEILEQQAQRYGELFALFLRHKSGIDRITFWNLHDGCSWLNNEPVPGRRDYPLLFDRAGNAKPAFFSVINSVQEIWPQMNTGEH
jgi:endo-1,4-beta-xylanase